jgi:hypothetical protein
VKIAIILINAEIIKYVYVDTYTFISWMRLCHAQPRVFSGDESVLEIAWKLLVSPKFNAIN